MCKTEQKPNENRLAPKGGGRTETGAGESQECGLRFKGGSESGGSRHVLRNFQKLALQDDAQSSHPVLQAQQQNGVLREVRTSEMAPAESGRLTGANFGGGTRHHA